MRRPLLFAIAVAGPVLALQACAVVSGGASVVSLMATKKTIMDHVVSFATDQDCSTISLERGDAYCIDPDAPPPVEPVYHCYRSLGAISCYESEDPFANRDREVR